MNALVSRIKRMQLGDVLRRNPLFYGEARRTLAQLDTADIQQRRAWTRERLGRVLWSARRTAYGQRIGGDERIECWPLLTKDAVRNQPRAFCTTAPWRAVNASTGGTSGAPLQLYRSAQAVAFEQAALDHLTRKLIGAAPLRCAVLRTEAIKDPNDTQPPFWIYAGGGERLVLSSIHLNATALDAIVGELARFSPNLLWTYPTSLENLCVLLQRAERRVTIPHVLCSSEMLHPRVWQAARERLGCQLLDYYGQAERVALAHATAPGEYRFLPGYAHVELEHVATEEGEHIYEIIGTGLWNTAMPLIRYRTGDWVRLPAQLTRDELEAITLGVKTFPGVIGRDSDILLTPDGARLTGISHFQRDVAHLVRIQVIQEALDRVRIAVVATPEFNSEDLDRLMHNVRDRVPHSVAVHIDRVESLEKTRLGKTPFVIHRPAVKQALLRGQARVAQ